MTSTLFLVCVCVMFCNKLHGNQAKQQNEKNITTRTNKVFSTNDEMCVKILIFKTENNRIWSLPLHTNTITLAFGRFI